MKEEVIVNKLKLSAVKKEIAKDGAGDLQVLADFDKTLTAFFVNGRKINSLISILRHENYLTPDYSVKAKALFNKYHPMEIDPRISQVQKEAAMLEWWTKHYDLLIESGLSKNDLKKVSQNENICLRAGAKKTLEILNELKIPLIIFSASGLGTEAIQLYLEKFNCFYDNINIVSNAFIWDENERAVDVKKPIVHTMNKNYDLIRQKDFYEKVKNKKNVILLGDSQHDVEMINDFEYKNIIKIGFLNENISENLEEFKKSFDIIILNDGPMDYFRNLLKELFLS